VYQGELEALGEMAESVKVQVAEDKIHGSLATITIKVAPGALAEDVRKKADELLGAYTVRYTLEIVF
jgi:fatty-acyl-CoA synthase